MLIIVTAMWRVHNSYATPTPDKPVGSYVYVCGEVHTPGRYGWFTGMTVVDAINSASGFTDFAGRRIKILHIDGRQETVNRDTPYVTNTPPMVKEGDMIFVPGVPKKIF